MLAELLLVMAGHASSFYVVADRPSSSTSKRVPWSWTLRLVDGSHALSQLHPGERASLEALASLAAKHLRVQLFAKSLLVRARSQALSSSSSSISSKRRQKAVMEHRHQSALFAPMGSCLLRLLKGYEQLVIDTESDILLRKEDIVNGEDSFVSLASVRARFEEWQAPLSALDALVSAILAGPESDVFVDAQTFDQTVHSPPKPPTCPSWPSGKLLDLVGLRADTGVGRVRACMLALVCSIEDAWRGALVAWMCYGDAQESSTFGIGSDPLVEWVGNSDEAGGREWLAMSTSSDVLPSLATTGDDDDEEMLKASALTGWRFVKDALPSSITDDAATAEAILYVGRALHTVKNRSASHMPNSGPRMLPETLTSSHVALLRSDQARPSTQPMDFRRAVARIREDVGEWMWRNVLTPEVVLGAFDALGDYFLHRKGLYATSLLQELSKLRHAKLVGTRTAAAGTIKTADIEVALQRASVGTEAEDDSHLELCQVIMPPRHTGNINEWKPTKLQGATSSKSSVRFDDIALGVPFTLRYSAPFPLDLILSPPELRAYSDLFSYLLALHATQARLRDCWTNLSKAQRSRRRFTGTGEGGVSQREERSRTKLLRMAWGAAREGLWFLEALGGHFQTDIIEVQYTRFLEQLQSLRPASQQGSRHERDGSGDSLPSRSRVPSTTTRKSAAASTAAAATSAAAIARARKESGGSSVRAPARHPFPSSSVTGGPPSVSLWQQARSINPAASTVGGTANMRRVGGAPTSTSIAAAPGEGGSGAIINNSGLDFVTSRSTHQAFLSFVLDGLLLTSREASACVRRILQTCLRFAALVDRWGGDVLPDLLSEGSVLGGASQEGGESHDEEVSATLRERSRLIAEVAEALRMHLDEFFALLSNASSTPSLALQKDGAGAPSPARHSTIDATPVKKQAGGTALGAATTSAAAARLDADSAARRHLEQLLLRLDWNGYLSARASHP